MSEGNNMQRVFDALHDAARPITIGSIERLSALPRESIRSGLRYLISQGFVRVSGSHNARLYTLKDGATRPQDRRGGPRRGS
jgi:DNA-binding IclR family transcriptional regulator